MHIESFWALIDAARKDLGRNSIRELPSILVEHVSKLSVEEIASFETHYLSCLDRAYDMRLWAAAFVICGGCSDDGFTDFRGWLIAHGKNVFENALVAPDTLVTAYDPATDETEGQLESMNYVASRAYRRNTGKDDWHSIVSGWQTPQVKNETVWDGDPSKGALARVVPLLCRKFFRGEDVRRL